MAAKQATKERIDEMLLQELTGRKSGTGSILNNTSDEKAVPSIPISPDGDSTQENAVPSLLPTPSRKGKHPSPYEELYLKGAPVRNRSVIYISEETKRKLIEIVRRMGWTSVSVSSYAENILSHHLDLFKDEINRLHRLHNSKDIL